MTSQALVLDTNSKEEKWNIYLRKKQKSPQLIVVKNYCSRAVVFNSDYALERPDVQHQVREAPS